jgi:hypothetical protein
LAPGWTRSTNPAETPSSWSPHTAGRRSRSPGRCGSSEALDRARAAKVIETEGSVIRFTHPLLASALYQAATGEERRDAHRKLAEVVDDPVHRARHLALAADAPSEELAAELESAASLASDRGLSIAAAELAEHALRWTPPESGGDRHRRAIAAARAHSAGGDGGRSRALTASFVIARPGRGGRRCSSTVGPRFPVAVETPRRRWRRRMAPRAQSAIHAALAEIDSGRRSGV